MMPWRNEMAIDKSRAWWKKKRKRDGYQNFS